ncbi:MAG: chromate transporter [Fusobacteriaceae bacterium]
MIDKKRDENSFLKEIFMIFFKIGMFTIGSGYAMLPVMEKEIVDKKKYLKKEEFIDILAVAQSCPGPFAVNTAIYTGYKLAKKKGGFAAALGAVLPSFVIMLIVAMFFQNIQENSYVESVFKGVKPTTVALIMMPVYTMGKSINIGKKNFWIPLGVAIGISFFKISAIIFIIMGLAGGIIYHSKIKNAEEGK